MPPPDENHVLPWQPYREAQKNGQLNNNVDIVSFPDAFAAHTGNFAELFVDHMHPSPIGTQVMARAIAAHLKSHPELLE